jgi:ADP-heptose:LPS heptosyltransferase
MSVPRETVTPEELERLSRQIANSFLDYYLKDCRYEEEYIDLLCEMTTFSNDPELINPGTHALFSTIVESLCDDFEELQTETYNRVMTQVISYCRTISAGKEFDSRLKEFGIYSSDDIINRIRKVRSNGASLSRKTSIQKVLLLSRVTIGADIAITSVIIQRLQHTMPDTQIVLIGSNKLKEVYGGNPRIKISEVPYSRKGGLLERLESWRTVLEIITEETDGLREDEVILIDPDSRHSQLGILPLVPDERYYFFDSRSDTTFNRKMSMPELTNDWFNRLTGEESFRYPAVWIPEHYLDRAAGFCSRFRNDGAKKIIAVNFGVGGNPRKRVSRHLEEKLLLTLLEEPGTVILLDKGVGNNEMLYTDSLINAVKEKGHPACHASLGSEISSEIMHRIIGIKSSIGEMAALIKNCNEYIGYDSACQHISAALKTPCITIFAGSNNMRFIRRWSAHGQNICNIVHVDTLTDRSLIDLDDIISRIMYLREIRSSLP